MLRVIAGSRRGVRLQRPKGQKTRPTADRTKESVFNMLGSHVAGARVLDLFSGSGALGIEALSRGAAEAVFVDEDRASIKVIRSNLENTSLAELARVIRARLPKGVLLGADGERFELVFMDPPYNQGLVGPTLEWLDGQGLVALQGIVVVEHSDLEDIPLTLENLKPFRERQFGQARITFLAAGEG